MTDICTRIWNESTRAVSVRVLYPEARAALAKAQRMGRISHSELSDAVAEVDAVVDQIDHIEISAQIARAAGELADRLALRGYDAVHLAAAQAVADDDLVFVTPDADLALAAAAVGLTVSPSLT